MSYNLELVMVNILDWVKNATKSDLSDDRKNVISALLYSHTKSSEMFSRGENQEYIIELLEFDSNQQIPAVTVFEIGRLCNRVCALAAQCKDRTKVRFYAALCCGAINFAKSAAHIH